VDQAGSDGRHAGAFLSSWITGPITGEMFTKITHISSMSKRFVGDGRLRLSGRNDASLSRLCHGQTASCQPASSLSSAREGVSLHVPSTVPLADGLRARVEVRRPDTIMAFLIPGRDPQLRRECALYVARWGRLLASSRQQFCRDVRLRHPCRYLQRPPLAAHGPAGSHDAWKRHYRHR